MKGDSFGEGDVVDAFFLGDAALGNDDGVLCSLFDGQLSEFRDNLSREKKSSLEIML